MVEKITSAEPYKAHSDTDPHKIIIHVNNKPVTVIGSRQSGLKIKQAAIDQGIPIKLDFVLSEIGPSDKSRIVGDEDDVTVNKNSRFRAVDNDDNS